MKIQQTPCPKCGKKTLSHPPFSPHDLRPNPSKDTGKAFCRSCGAKFTKKDKPKELANHEGKHR